MLKSIFQGFHPKIKNFNISHFNIPKFCALVHFKENIRLYKCTNGYCIGVNGETGHHYIVKAFCNLINKWDLLSQICFHNLRQVTVLIIEKN